MKRVRCRLAFAVRLLVLTALCGCISEPTNSFGAPGAPYVEPAASARAVRPHARYQIIYSFTDADGTPGALVNLNDALYGTSFSYSSSSASAARFFTIDESGHEDVLHLFPAAGDAPTALTALRGALYGIGACPNEEKACAVLLRLRSNGDVSIIRRFFNDIANGTQLLAANDMFYGYTRRGNGTIFSLTTSGDYHVLYRFHGGTDGAGPSGLLPVFGGLYGTTTKGGADGFGTVFAISPMGRKYTIYSFKNGSDGENPRGSLVAINGKLYGITLYGGSNQCPESGNTGPPGLTAGCGTVYSVTPSGEEHVIYNFDQTDGFPAFGLIRFDGGIYGTTEGLETAFVLGTSVIFRVTTGGVLVVLHRFGIEKRDANWAGGLTLGRGALYGTGGPGGYGGAYNNGIIYRLNVTAR